MVSLTLVVSCEYHRKFLKKTRNCPYGIVRGLGELIHVENLKSKISWQCPFKFLSSNFHIKFVLEVQRQGFVNTSIIYNL
jgi:hypothetical protein